MSGYSDGSYPEQGSETYWSDQATRGTSYNFDMTGNQFGQELNFQSFDAGQTSESQYAGAPLYGANPYLDPMGGAPAYHGEIFTPSGHAQAQQGYGDGTSDFDQEPPLLEVRYKANKKSWMTAAFFSEWFDFNRQRNGEEREEDFVVGGQ